MKIPSGVWKDWDVSPVEIVSAHTLVYIVDKKGNRLNEWNAVWREDNYGPVVTIFLECEHNQKFSISVDGPALDTACIIRYWVDGSQLSGRTTNENESFEGYKEGHIYQQIAGHLVKKRLTFKRLTFSDNGVDISPQACALLGTIKVQLATGSNEERYMTHRRPTVLSPSNIRKGTNTEADTSVQNARFFVPASKKYQGVKFVEDHKYQPPLFVFKYRTRKTLIAQGIIPSSTTPKEKSPEYHTGPADVDSTPSCGSPLKAIFCKRRACKNLKAEEGIEEKFAGSSKSSFTTETEDEKA